MSELSASRCQGCSTAVEKLQSGATSGGKMVGGGDRRREALAHIPGALRY